MRKIKDIVPSCVRFIKVKCQIRRIPNHEIVKRAYLDSKGIVHFA